MDIVAESLSAKILKSREVLVNGQDIMDYIRSKLSTAVEFSGVYDSLKEANAAGANFNGSIVIVGSKEYIWSDKDNSWHQIGDETAVGQLVEYFDALSAKVDNLSNDLIYAITSTVASLEDIPATLNYAGVKKMVFMPSYLGMKSSDTLTSIVLQTRSSGPAPILTGDNFAYVRARKYAGLGVDGQSVGISQPFHWPDKTNEYVQIDFNSDIQFTEPDSQYYFEFLSGSISEIDQTPLNAFGVNINVLNTSDPKLSTLSSHYFVVGAQYSTETIYAQFRPLLSVNYRHPYSMAELEAQTNAKYNELIGEASDLSSASTINAAKNYAKDLVNSLDVADTPTTGKFVVAVSQENGVISVQKAALTIPEGLSSYVDTVANLSNDGYVLSTELSTKNKVEISQEFEGQFVQTDLSIIKVVDADLQTYAAALNDGTLNPNALYVLQLSKPNAFGQQIHNVADGSISSDAATYGQLISANNSISATLSSTTTQVANELSNTISSVANELSNTISSKVYVGNLQSGEHANLSVLKVTSDEYQQLVADANSSGVDLSNNVIYIVSSDNMNMYGEKILNLTMTEDDEQSEATNKHYVDSLCSSLIGNTSDLSSASTINAAKNYAKDLVNSSLSTKNKVEISQAFEGQFVQTDLSIIKVVDEDLPAYAKAMHDNALNPNALYVLQLSAPNALGQPIHDIASGVLDSDAATYGQLVSANNAVSSVLSSLSTYAEVKQQLSDDGYATQTNIPSYSDISANIHLSNYALSNDVSSKVDLEAAFNQKLDATAAGKAFSPLSTYSLYEHVSYNGQLYECSAVVSATGDFQLSNWQLVDMTSPDATLDITNQGQLRLVAADGTTLWHQGYNLAVSSSTTLSIDAVNRYDFAWNATSATALTIPTLPNGKVGDFILDVTLTALAPFLSTMSYDAGRHVIQDEICWTSTTSADAGSWDAVSGNWTSVYAAWDQTSSYTSADNPVVKDGMLWKCVAASTTAGDWTPSDWTTASFGLPQLEAESIKVVVPENNNLADMLTFAPGQMAELYFTQTSFTASGQPTWKVVRQNVEEVSV